MPWSRRTVLRAAPLGFVGGLTFVAPAAADGTASVSLPDEFPSQPPELVREIVGASHAKLDRVRELLALRPALAKAAWDWGFGDWETALGAASHTGQREIAALLIEHGARPDLFTFAMLGQLDVVKSLIAANPGVQRLHGPHGITLLKHAQAGGAKSAAVVEYLASLGDADIGQKSIELDSEWAQRYVGEYSPGPREEDRLLITTGRRGELAIRRGKEGTPRVLFHQGQHAFHPTGAPRVVIRFEVESERIARLRIIDGDSERVATRID